MYSRYLVRDRLCDAFAWV